MQFDSNRAWQEAAASVQANRDVLFPVAGVFFLLPSLAAALFMPQPQPEDGATPEQAMAALGQFYADSALWLLPVVLLQAVGTLAMLALFTDRRRPTVAQAIRLGATGLLPYLAAQLLFGLAVGVIGGTLLAVSAASGVAVLAILVGFFVAAGAAYGAVKTSLSAPLIMVEGMRNPVAALRRSWELTRGNSFRLALFYVLVVIAFLIVTVIVSSLFGLLGMAIGGAEAARALNAVVSSAFGAVMTLYLAAILAAVHRQLAGPSPESIGSTFE